VSLPSAQAQHCTVLYVCAPGAQDWTGRQPSTQVLRSRVVVGAHSVRNNCVRAGVVKDPPVGSRSVRRWFSASRSLSACWGL